jgi:hypothetical protein
MGREPFRNKYECRQKSTEASIITVGVTGMSTQSTVFLEEPAVVLEGWEAKGQRPLWGDFRDV